MKTTLLFMLILAGTHTWAQENPALQPALKIFQSKVKPHLKDLVDREYGSGRSKTEDDAKQSRLLVLETKVSVINQQVAKALSEGKLDLDLMAKTISRYYKDMYTGLPREFYDSAEEAVRKMN